MKNKDITMFLHQSGGVLIKELVPAEKLQEWLQEKIESGGGGPHGGVKKISYDQNGQNILWQTPQS
jgi:hypothetical protein